jgi:hypothetical protein
MNRRLEINNGRFSLSRPNTLSLLGANTLEAIAMLGVILVGIALRFYNLGRWSFWGDEYITVMRVQTLDQLSLTQRSLSLILTGWAMELFGVSEWSARLVPSVFGILTIPVLYLLARRMFNRQVALFASAFLAISPWHLYWSQNARFYTALLLFSMLGLFLFYLGLEENRPWYLVASLFFFGLSFSERPIGAFFVLVAALYIALLWCLPSFKLPPGAHWRNLLIFIIPGVIGGSIILFQFPGISDPARWASNFGFVNNNPLWILAGVVYYLGIPLLVAAAGGAYFLLRRNSRPGLLLALAFAIPLGLIMVISLFQYTANRYVFIVLPAVALLAAVGVWELLRQNLGSARPVAVALVLTLFVAPLGENALYNVYQNGNRDDWKGAFAWIEEHKEPGDLVITTHRDLADYYLEEKTIGFRRTNIQQLADGQERLWFIVDLTTPSLAPGLMSWFQKNGRQVAEMDVTVNARTFPMRVYLYDP